MNAAAPRLRLWEKAWVRSRARQQAVCFPPPTRSLTVAARICKGLSNED